MAGVTFNRSDLDFILTQIGFAESGQQPVNPHLAFGLRQIDGQNNSTVEGQPLYGAAGQAFPRLTNPVFQNADALPSGSPFGVGPTSYSSANGYVYDAAPRIISNLIVDQSAHNPAAVAAAAAAAAQLGDGYTHAMPGLDGILGTSDDIVINPGTPTATGTGTDHSLFINNVTPDNGLSAPFNSLFTLFGQFFDHGLDLTAKGGGGTVLIPLQPDDPLYVDGGHANFMVLTRATNQPGPDGVLGTADDIRANTNLVTPFVDQNQTYTSHPSHQVFLREYTTGADGNLHSTGRLLEGIRPDGSHGEPTWADIKANALTLGIRLNDTIDVVNIPLVKVDAYGNFIPDPVSGLAQLVTNLGADGQYGTDDDVVVHGTRDADGTIHPINTDSALRIGTAFLNDIAASANPVDPTNGHFLIPDTDGIVNDATHPVAAGRFDVDLLNQHFIAGDGRANENVGLTAIHEIFHDEHNRLVEQTKDVVRAELAKGDTAFASAWVLDGVDLSNGIQDNEWNGERLFQAGKFGTETQYQHLVFEEFARKVSPAIHLFGNTNVHLDPSITEEFANAVYRFGHSMLDENLNRYLLQPDYLDANGKPTTLKTGTVNPLAGTPVMDANGHPVLNEIGLISAFTNPLEYASHGANAAGEIALGSVNQVGNEIDEFVTGTLRTNLLGLPLDLAALNIARGRDVGIAPLNLLRNQIYTASHDTSVKPYESWTEFGQFLKHEGSLINFVAAYGTHASIQSATSVVDKRAAALTLVTDGSNEANHGAGGVKGEAYDFLHSLGAYAHVTDPLKLQANPNALHNADGTIPVWSTGDVTGLDHVDLWIGGLAEKQNLFGGLLGSTFDFIFRNQMENLQDADRLYYLPRLEGTHFGSEIEGNSFAEMIMHNTGAQHVSASVFLTPEYTVETAAVDPNDTTTWTHNPVSGKLLLEASWVLNPDGTHAHGSDGADIKSVHFLGDDNFLGNTMVLGGTVHDDVLLAGNADDDTVYGDAGKDRIDGGNGNDFLYGGEGNDIITDTAGDDVIHGDAGNDVIDAGIGDDIVFGGDGNDVINGGKGIDDILGGLGNDIIRAGEGDDEVLGNEGNDWIEGGQGGDVLTGDVGAPTGQLPLYGGDDVLIGGSYIAIGSNGHPIFNAANALSNNGGDKMLAFSGDDVMIGGGGFNTFRGGKGFDWASFEFDGQGISVDMNRKDFVLDSPPLSPDAIRDVFIETEGLSGSSYNDELLGTNDARVDTTNELTNINLITNLNTFFPQNAPVHYNSGNIILGGGGSDRISGGGGNDVVDGDAYLHVGLQNGQILREIVDGARSGDVDTAVYSDIAADYAVGAATADGRGWDGLDAEGFFSVVHVTLGPGGGGALAKVVNDGVDKVRNIERLEFQDGVHTVSEFVFSVPVKNQLPFGTVTITGTPVIGNILTANAALQDLDAGAGSQSVTSTTYQWEYLDPARAQWVPITGAHTQNLKVAAFEVGLPIRVVASFVDAKGYTESIVSDQTALVTTAPGVNTAPFIVPQQGQVGLPDTTVLDTVPVNLFLPVTTVFGDAQTAATALIYKVTLANGAALSTIGLSADVSGVVTNGAVLITGTLNPGATGPFDIRVSATDAGPGTPLTVSDTFTMAVVHPSSGAQAVINGSLQDGYIAGATVFMDSNGDGLHQSFEAQTTTDATGHFSLSGKPGALIAFGGPGALDIATQLPFDGVYKAPAGSTVLTPLTSILSACLDLGLTLSDAQAALRSALQLDPSVDLTIIDPISTMHDPNPAQKALAVHLFVTSSQILNTVALLHAAAPNADPMAEITTLLMSGVPFNLADPTTVGGLVASSGLFGAFADDAAKIVLASNALLAERADPALDADQILIGVTAVSIVAKGVTATALDQAFTLSEMDAATVHFTGALLASEVAKAMHQVGDVNGDGIGDATTATPDASIALVNTLTSVVENTGVQGGFKVSDIVIVDDNVSADVVSLTGSDASSFEVRDKPSGKELWYVGSNLDFESGKTAYNVTVSVANPQLITSTPITAALTMTVLNVNETPVSVADGYTTAEDAALVVSAANGVLKNDTDPDNVTGGHQDPMSATLVTGPQHGALVLSADGSFVYTPSANYNSEYDPTLKLANPGPDSFTYMTSDGQFTSAPVTVMLGVSPVNDAPTGSVSIAGEAKAGSTLTASNTLTDADGLGSVTYHWLLNGTDSSVTGLSYTVAQADVGKAISVRASYTDGSGTPEAVTSAATAPVVEGSTIYIGTAGADGFTATSAANWTLSGLDGNDSLTGAGGNDTLDGGLGNDTLTGGAGNDTFLVRGTEASADSLQGGLGTADTLKVEGTAALTLVGFDTSLNGIEVWSGNGKGVVGTGAANRFDLSGLSASSGLPWLDGAGGNDTLVGSGFADDLRGGAGNDTLTGGAGNDLLTGGAGNDSLSGGDGTDTAVLSGARASYTIADLGGGSFRITDGRTGGDGVDVLTGVERASFAGQLVTLVTSNNSAPTSISLTANSVAENKAAGTLVGSLSSTDPDTGDTASYTLTDPSGHFALISGNQIVTTTVLDHEAAGHLHTVQVQVTDSGGLSFVKDFSLDVTDVNEAPSDIALSSTQASGTAAGSVVGALSAIDPDTGDTPLLSLLDNAGDHFRIENGGLVVNAALTGSSYSVVVQATDQHDASLSYQESFTITVPGVAGVSVTGTAGADLINATSTPGSTDRADTLLGLGGNDSLDGGAGNDSLDGGAGADLLVGGAGADHLIGGTGLDTASYVGAGSGVKLDMLLSTWTEAFGDARGDSLSGIEAIDGSNFDDVFLLTNLDDRANGGGGNDRIEGRDGLDILKGLAGNDTLDGGLGADQLDGGDGNDALVGGSGADKLLGGAGVDRLEGGADQDLLTGSGGSDTFVFASNGTGMDLITDFAGGVGLGDVIEWHEQFTSFAAVSLHAQDFSGAASPFGGTFSGTVITTDVGDQVWLANISKANLHADDFTFF